LTIALTLCVLLWLSPFVCNAIYLVSTNDPVGQSWLSVNVCTRCL